MQKNVLYVDKPYVIICEGRDEWNFIVEYLKFLRQNLPAMPDSFNVLDYGGIDQQMFGLRELHKQANYSDIKSLLIVRDAERNATAAVQSVRDCFKNHLGALIDSDGRFVVSDDGIKVGFVLFPGYDQANGFLSGTLEDLCVQILKDNSSGAILEYTDCCLEKIKEDIHKGVDFRTKHKNRLHSYFSATDGYVGLKIGEAAKAGAFDFGSPQMDFVRSAIMGMVQ